MSDWYELEKCYLTEKGKALIEKLSQAGFDQNLAMEMAHELMPHSDLYNLDGDDHG